MNVDQILKSLNDQHVDYMLIGGMNFLIRHIPELTYDVDIWVLDDADNLARLNRALEDMGAEWGRTDADWKAVPQDSRWLRAQNVFCLTTKFGALDIFREVRGLEGQYAQSKIRSIPSRTAAGVIFSGLSDDDMLACQEALDPQEQKEQRVKVLREAIRASERSHGQR
jgi:hypothetical protein